MIWIIIGGGIQGCTLATHLVQISGVNSKDIKIIDTHSEPLHLWKELTNRTGMEYLRSPGVHHIDPKAFSLKTFGKNRASKSFYQPYDRPALPLFNEHCNSTIENNNLNQCWVQGTVIQISKRSNKWYVLTDDKRSYSAENICLAIGVTDAPYWPDWARTLQQKGQSVYHLFDQNFPLITERDTPISVIGGGISAVQTALLYARQYPGKVSLVMRHPFRVHQFDSPPGWLGPKEMHKFSQIKDYEQRRTLIKHVRHKGSIPRELHLEIKKAHNKRYLDIIQTESFQDHCQAAKTIVLATGFEQKPPGNNWLKELIQTHNLQCAKCGYPIVNHHLEWTRGLYTIGALAELELGPVSRNIAGARRGANRIALHQKNVIKTTDKKKRNTYQ